MHSTSFVFRRFRWLFTVPLAWGLPPAFAQVMVYPDVIAAYSLLPAAREPAPEDPAAEPIVTLASLVLALGDALGSNTLTLEPKTALAVELQLSALIDLPVLSRAEALRFATDLTTTLPPRQLIALVGVAQKRNYAARPRLLGVESATANPFYNPGSIPGYAARFVLAQVEAQLHPAEAVAP